MRRPPSRSWQRGAWLLCVALALVVSCVTVGAHAGPKRGDVLQTDSLSMLLVSHDYTTNTNSSIRNVINLSGNVGLHYYFVDRVRFGMNVQFTERIWPEPPGDSSRFQRFALMPQLGWSFYDPFYTALIFSYAPRTLGRAVPDMAVLAALGATFPITERMKFSVALEVPFAFLHHRTLGLVALTGVSFRF
jgi:hypothetical protein